MPLPSAARSVPSVRTLPGVLVVIGCSFAHACRVLSRCAGHPAAVPLRQVSTQPVVDLGRAAAGGASRPAVALLGEPRPGPPPAAPAGAARRPAGQSAGALPAHPRLPGRRPAPPASSDDCRPRAPSERLPWRLCTKSGTYPSRYISVPLSRNRSARLSTTCTRRGPQHGPSTETGEQQSRDADAWGVAAELWWRRWDSNPRPPACKAGALAS